MLDIESLKRWHWALIGLAAALIVGGSRAAWVTEVGQGPGRTLSQDAFERELLQNVADTDGAEGGDGAGNRVPKLSRLKVLPPDADGNVWVIGQRLGEVTLNRQDPADPQSPLVATATEDTFRYRAREPYRPLHAHGVPTSPDLTVRDYLGHVKAKQPEAAFSYTYAWWRVTPVNLALWGTGGLVAGGVVWPALLAVLIGAGFGRPPKDPAYDLDRFNGAPEPAKPAPAEDADLARRFAEHLAELERELEAGLQAGRAPAPAGPAAAAAPLPPAALPAAPLADPPPAAAEQDKDFWGEYYPVTHNRPHPKPPDEPRA